MIRELKPREYKGYYITFLTNNYNVVASIFKDKDSTEPIRRMQSRIKDEVYLKAKKYIDDKQ